jgi:hypothetical protein
MSRAADDSSGTDSLATPRPLEDGDAAAALAAHESLSELFYNTKNCSLKALELLSLGLKNDDGTPTFDLTILPWSAALHPTTLKMTTKDLQGEVPQRSVAAENVLNAPHPGQWTVAKATEWLNNNPIVATHEVAFIHSTIAHRIAVAQHANLAQPGGPSNCSDVQKGSKWFGKYPYLHLIHAIIDDGDIKAAYIWWLHVVQSNVWYMVAQKWNDQSFLPTTLVKNHIQILLSLFRFHLMLLQSLCLQHLRKWRRSGMR